MFHEVETGGTTYRFDPRAIICISRVTHNDEHRVLVHLSELSEPLRMLLNTAQLNALHESWDAARRGGQDI